MDMLTIWTGLYLIVMAAALLLNVFSLPGNWIMLGLAAVWKVFHPQLDLTWGIFAALCVVALLAEGFEFFAQMHGAKKFGSSKRGNIGGIIGAIAGAIFGAPILFGIGAIFGAILGAFAGCLIMELGHGRSFPEARHAAWGAFWGKLFGMVIKFSMGAALFVMIIPQIWP